MAEIKVRGTEMVSMDKIHASDLEDLGFNIKRNSDNTMAVISGGMFLPTQSSFTYCVKELNAIHGVMSNTIENDDIIISFLK